MKDEYRHFTDRELRLINEIIIGNETEQDLKEYSEELSDIYNKINEMLKER